jgi:hypothetical protein
MPFRQRRFQGCGRIRGIGKAETSNIGILYSGPKLTPMRGGYAGAMNDRPIRTCFIAATLVLAGCGAEKPAPPKPPSKAEAVVHEADLLRLTLTPEAQQRLGIRTVTVADGTSARIREVGGELVVPGLGPAGVPTGSTSNIAQIAAAQAAADGEVARTTAQLRLATIARDRAAALVREEAGSVRARDEAEAALAAARAAADVAREQRRQLGPAVASMASQPLLWVRVPVFGSDVQAIDRARPAMIRPLGDPAASPQSARPVSAPPSANAVAGTVDLFYALDNRARTWRVVQRVAVALPMGGAMQGLTVPTAAIVRDINGGEWVYRKTGPGTYLRQRIEIASVSGDTALLARGLDRGAEIVTDGAAELFGTEFGTPH